MWASLMMRPPSARRTTTSVAFSLRCIGRGFRSSRFLCGVRVGREDFKLRRAGGQSACPGVEARTIKKALGKRIQRCRLAVGHEGGVEFVAHGRAEKLHADAIEHQLARLGVGGKRRVTRQAGADVVEHQRG